MNNKSVYTKHIESSKSHIAICLVTLLCLFACGENVVPSETQTPDPVVVDVPIAYIQRDLSISDSTAIRNLEDPASFSPGARLVIKARANNSAPEVDISSAAFAEFIDEDGLPLPYDIKDLDSDYSGNKLIFAMRAPQTDEIAIPPTWNIYEYDRNMESIRRVISADLAAEAGDDTGPTYLADGRIVFSSTRQRGNQARLLDEGKPQYAGLEEGRDVAASVLHVMNADGTNIQQISFNQSHDFDPVVLPNGKILFSRWDQANGNKGIHLYQMNADGSDLEIVYGRHSHDSIDGLDNVQYAATSITPDSRVLAAVLSFNQSREGTDFIAIDTQNYVENNVPIASMPSLSGPAQQSALFDNIDLIADISPGGYFNALYPLWDGSDRIIFSWNQCRLLAPLPEGSPSDAQRTVAPCSEENIANPLYTTAPDLYSLWMYTPASENTEATQLPLNVADENQVITEIVALETRPFPANPVSTVDISATNLIDDEYGVLHIRSVYDLDGEDLSPNGIVNMANPLAVAVNQRPARFLRVVKSVSVPDEETLDFDNAVFGRSRNQLFREILGYTPIQPDGSVKVAVPAGVPFSISVLDERGRRISPRHNNWLQLVAGEQQNCIGCHTANSTAPHGRKDAQANSINVGASTNGQAFPNTNPDLFADAGETMAETLARVQGLPRLTANISFDDIWVDQSIQAPTPSFEYRYQDLSSPLPIEQSCAQNWTALCRAVINFPEHIAPIFTLERLQFDEEMNVLADNTCNSCHSLEDNNAMAQVPKGQLDLRDTLSQDNPNFLTSYRELMFNDTALELIEGNLLEQLVPVVDGNGNPVFERDENGELILDELGNPIPVLQTVNVRASMNTNGALASSRFFAPFEPGESHEGMLTDAELRLITEWLDIGGQYYNNPFDVPQE